jgi:hypothetical protein
LRALSRTFDQRAPKEAKVFWFAQGGLNLFSKKNAFFLLT